MAMSPREVHAALDAYVSYGERAGWDEVLEQLRNGELVLEVTEDGVLITAPTG